jgi:Protein of unknown function (DUF559)
VNKDLLLIDVAIQQHRLISRADVVACGLSSQQWCDRLEDGTWVAEAGKVFRHRATLPTWELRVRATAKSLGKHAALFGASAARWWGLEGYGDDDRIDFVAPRARRSLDPAVHLHTTKQWDAADLQSRDGVRVATVTRTLIDLASAEPIRSLERAIDCAVRLRLTSIPTLTRRMGELASGRRGIGVLREMLLDSCGESFLERRFLRLVRHADPPLPQCQVASSANGRAIRVDFEFAGTNVIVEVSGRLGHTSDGDRQRDARRRNALQQQGKTVLEFTTVDVLSSPEYVLATLQTSGVVPRRPSPRRSRRDNPGN